MWQAQLIEQFILELHRPHISCIILGLVLEVIASLQGLGRNDHTPGRAYIDALSLASFDYVPHDAPNRSRPASRWSHPNSSSSMEVYPSHSARQPGSDEALSSCDDSHLFNAHAAPCSTFYMYPPADPGRTDGGFPSRELHGLMPGFGHGLGLQRLPEDVN